MSEITLHKAEALHRLIGDGCIAVGLRARYEGALAHRFDAGMMPAFHPAVWRVVERDDFADLDEGLLELAGEDMFRLSAAQDAPAGTMQSWTLTIDGELLTLHVFAVTEAGRAHLEALKAALGAQ